MEFKNKVAIVTGGAQGIGRCIADEFQKGSIKAPHLAQKKGL